MTPFKLPFLSVALGGALLVHLGCAGDESSAHYDVSVDSGIAPDKLLVSLTDQEANMLCDATADAASEIYSFERQRDAACTLVGVTLSLARRPDGMFQVDRAACERSRDECLMNVMRSEVVETRTCEFHPMRATTGAACTASVAEYETCMTAALYATVTALDPWSCALLAAQPLAASPSGLPKAELEVPECASFEAKCGALPAP
jgi:hypothetical protein